MKITFVIGNGFDIGLGLKTSYRDFIAEYADLTQPYDSREIESRLKEKISRDRKTWEDAEVAFAKLPFSSMFGWGADVKRCFLEVLSKFQSALAHYIQREEDKLDTERCKECQSEFINRVIVSLVEGDQIDRQNTDKASLCKERNELNCINFNYTTTFDKLFCVREPEVPVVEFSPQQKASFKIGKVVHIHGQLVNNDSIFGVSFPGQIDDKAVKELCELTGAFIKHRQDSQFGANNYRAATDLVSKSDWIVVFGTSMGMSDSYWWELLISQLKYNPNLRIFVFLYSSEPKPIESKIDWQMLQFDGRDQFIRSHPERKDDIEMQSLHSDLDRVTILRYGPYKGVEGVLHMGDPWDLNYFGARIMAQ